MTGRELESPVLPRLQALVPDAIESTFTRSGEQQAVLRRARLKRVMGRLLNDEVLGSAFLWDLSVLPRLEADGGMEVVYVVRWPEWGRRVVFRVRVPEPDRVVPSLAGIWPCASWLEREAWDLHGIVFEGHPDLRRILLPEESGEHPLAPGPRSGPGQSGHGMGDG